MKKIFLLEDDPSRVNFIRNALVGVDAELTHAWDVERGLAKWDGPYDVVLLDHDLGGEIFVDSANDNTGCGFARRLPDGAIGEETTVWVHSYNPDGAREIGRILRERFPFLVQLTIYPFGPRLLGWLSTL